MAVTKHNDSERPRRRRATTPEARENQLIAAATNLAEKQLLDGTASAQVITHYLKLATSKEQLEQKVLRSKGLLLDAQVENLASGKRMEELYGKAIEAMRGYSGETTDDDDGDYFD